MSRKTATALRYEGGVDVAPRVVATAAGEAAERIIALAKEHGVPVGEDAALADALHKLSLEAQIPAELYEAVAAVLVWAYRVDAAKRRL